VAVNRAAIVEEIRARRAWMKATGRLNRRRPMPRQQAPDAVRLSYLSALLAGPLARARELVREQLEPRLPGLVAEADLSRGDAAARLDETASDVNALLDRISDEWFGEWPNERLAALARRFADRTSEFQREQLARQFKATMGIDVLRSEPWLAPKVSTFTAENVALIKSVAQDHFTDLEKRMISGLRSGQRWEELAETARARYGVSESRAKLIARDQVGKLYGDLNRTRQKDLGVAKYRWRTMNDNRVRDGHEEREGEVYLWDDPPEDGHPGEPVQCRCYGDPILDELIAEMTGEAPAAAPAPEEEKPAGVAPTPETEAPPEVVAPFAPAAPAPTEPTWTPAATEVEAAKQIEALTGAKRLEGETYKTAHKKFGDRAFRIAAKDMFGDPVTAERRVGFLNEVGEALSDLRGRFPAIREALTKDVVFLPGPAKKQGMVAWSSRASTGERTTAFHLSFGPAASSKGTDRLAAYARENGGRRWVVGDFNPAANTRHELGHLVQETLKVDIRPLIDEVRKESGDSVPGAFRQWVQRNVSDYAATKDEELFAELAGMVTDPGYTRGTLPAGVESFMFKVLGSK
jgi:SPP1 gp7 family putative phage head morphogenesis protein